MKDLSAPGLSPQATRHLQAYVQPSCIGVNPVSVSQHLPCHQRLQRTPSHVLLQTHSSRVVALDTSHAGLLATAHRSTGPRSPVSTTLCLHVLQLGGHVLRTWTTNSHANAPGVSPGLTSPAPMKSTILLHRKATAGYRGRLTNSVPAPRVQAALPAPAVSRTGSMLHHATVLSLC